MDKETLTNHITRLGKRDFETACRLVLSKVFNLNSGKCRWCWGWRD